jgi:Zn finger protein HypA/HybF involved in hydrogenase expression
MNKQGDISIITGRYMCSHCGKTVIVNAGELLPACPGCNKTDTSWTVVTDLSWVMPTQAGIRSV